MQIIKILLPIAKLFPLDYKAPIKLRLNKGNLVNVSFRKRYLVGIVWELNVHSKIEKDKIKTIEKKLPNQYYLSLESINLITWVSKYYITTLGCAAKLVLPFTFTTEGKGLKQQEVKNNPKIDDLNNYELKTLNLIKNTKKPSLIHETNDCKINKIYYSLIKEYLLYQKQILILIPEIISLKLIVDEFFKLFGFNPTIWNSNIAKKEKESILHEIFHNTIKVIITTRSGLFLPYKNLGLIIVYQEHDALYKENYKIHYNARDCAVMLNKFNKQSKLLLCSSTPSIESINNTKNAKYQLIQLQSKKDFINPEIKIVDMHKEKFKKNFLLSKTLISTIYKNLHDKKTVILFFNRNGYASLIFCMSCGYRFNCKFCSTTLILYKSTNNLKCNYCNYKEKMPLYCPECSDTNTLKQYGGGIEKLEEEIKLLFPYNKTFILNTELFEQKKNIKSFIEKKENFEIEILIATKVLHRYFNFSNLGLVSIIDADLGAINKYDFTSNERNFQILQYFKTLLQKKKTNGILLLQTYYPDNILFEEIEENDDEFWNSELATRKKYNMPPFTKMARIMISSKNEFKALKMSKILLEEAPQNPEVKILGPEKAQIYKIAGYFRYNILIITEKKFPIQNFLLRWITKTKTSKSWHLKIDIDPKKLI